MKTKGFDGTEYFRNYANYFKTPSYNEVDDRILGMLVRRYIDGSITTIFKITNIVLKDYDKQFYCKKKLPL